MSENKRIKCIDVAKGLGIFFIVLGHVLTTGTIRKILFSFHVPLFFILSGLCYKVENDNKSFIIKKIKSLYVPYVVISIISIAIYLLLGKFVGAEAILSIDNINKNLFGMLYVNSNLENMEWNQPLWFIPTLIISLIIMNTVWNLIKSEKKRFCVSIIITIIGLILSRYKIYFPFQIETACSMFIWIYLGTILKKMVTMEKVEKYINCSKTKLFLVALILLGIGIVVANLNEIVSVRQDRYGNYGLYFMSSLLLSLATLAISIRIKENKVMEYVGRNTLIILLFHKFPILFFQKICPFIKEMLVNDNIAISMITSILVSFITILMCLLIKIFEQEIRRNYDRYQKQK